MRLSDSVRAIADATGQPYGRVNTVARRLQEVDAIPLGPGGRVAAEIGYSEVALILLALMVNVPRHIAAKIAVDVASYSADGKTAGDFVAWILSVAADVNSSAARIPAKASLTVHFGDRKAVSVRIDTSDGDPVEMAFTEDGDAFEPHNASAITASFTLPGIVLDRLGHALAGLRT